MSEFLSLRKFKNFHSNSNFHLNSSTSVARDSQNIYIQFHHFGPKFFAAHLSFLLICIANRRPIGSFGPTVAQLPFSFLHLPPPSRLHAVSAPLRPPPPCGAKHHPDCSPFSSEVNSRCIPSSSRSETDILKLHSQPALKGLTGHLTSRFDPI
jgi:hypothetical protein